MTTYLMIPTEDGKQKPWKPLSARIEQFNKDYPATQGYRVILKRADALSYQEGLLKLYQMAVGNGHDPVKVGLPPIKEVPTMVMEASLMDKNNLVLANASAAREVLEIKDWEKLESNARHRLLEILGYTGEILDADELALIEERAKKAASDAPPVRPAAEQPKREPVAVPPATVGSTTESSGAVPPAVPAEQESSGKVHTLKPGGKKIQASVLNQIKRLCAQKKIDVPVFDSTEAALKYLADLRMPPKATTG